MALSITLAGVRLESEGLIGVSFASGRTYLIPTSDVRRLGTSSVFVDEEQWERAVIALLAHRVTTVQQAQAFVGRSLVVDPDAAANLVRIV